MDARKFTIVRHELYNLCLFSRNFVYNFLLVFVFLYVVKVLSVKVIF